VGKITEVPARQRDRNKIGGQIEQTLAADCSTLKADG
jgi:hypothetical protein